MKSNSISKSRGPYGMGDVVKPHVLTYSATFHQWLLRGVSASRTLPTICAHLFSVVQASFQEASGKAGQQSGKSETAVRGEFIITLVTAKRSTAASFPFSPCVASIGAARGRWQFRSWLCGFPLRQGAQAGVPFDSAQDKPVLLDLDALPLRWLRPRRAEGAWLRKTNAEQRRAAERGFSAARLSIKARSSACAATK